MDDKEKVIQLIVQRGADNKPFMACLTSFGRMFVSENIFGDPKWSEVEKPDLIPF